MPRAVACPKCRVELDIPEELLGEPVRCASCATTFTPARDDRRNAALDDDDVPRRRPEPRASGRGLLGVASVLLAGTFGVCCLGCAGLGLVSVRLDKPTLQVYQSPDGQFEAGFPGVPTPTEYALSDALKLSGVAHTRHVLGDEFDTSAVQFYDLPKAPATDATRDRVLQETADAYVAGQADMAKASQKKLTTQGYPTLEVVMAGDDPQLSHFARVVVAGRRVYVLSYDGHALPPQSQRLANFWDAFRVLNAPPDPAADKPADKPRAKAKVKPKDQ